MGLVERIKEIAAQKGILIADLERTAGLSDNSIYRWDRTDPGHSKVVRVAEALGVSLDELHRKEEK